MSASTNPWYQIHNIDEFDTPLLAIFPQRVKRNIRTAIDMVGDTRRLRPHVKTNKCMEAIVLMMDEGIEKFKCATIAEAEMMGMCQAKHVLLAYQPLGPKLKRFIDVIQKFPRTRYACLTDHFGAASEIADASLKKGLQMEVYLDLNVGQDRSGIAPEQALELYLECASLSGLKPAGLHVYDGHLRDVDYELRKEKCDAAFLGVLKLKEEIMRRGYEAPNIIAGGSPTFSIHCKRSDIECSPGTFIYWDKGYLDLCPEQDFIPAALVISRVISMPTTSRLCLDLGHKSVAAENELSKRVYFLNAPELKAVGQSEEHLVVEAGAGHQYGLGDAFYGLPIHICPTVALYERAMIVHDGWINGEWKTIARDKKITI